MKKLRGSFAAKLIAVILLSASALVCFAAAFGMYSLNSWGAYSGNYDNARSKAVEDLARNHLYELWEAYNDGVDLESLNRGGNFRVTILTADGTELCSDYDHEQTLWQGSLSFSPDIQVESWMESGDSGDAEKQTDVDSEARPEVTPTPSPMVTPQPTAEPSAVPHEVYDVYVPSTGESLRFDDEQALRQWQRENSRTVRGYVLADLPGNDVFSERLQTLNTVWAWRYVLPGAAAASFLVGVLLFIFLLAAAGHRDAGDTITESFADRIPLDLFTLLIAAAELLLAMLLIDPGWSLNVPGLMMMAFLFLLMGLSFLLWCMSFAVRVKRHELWQNCLIVRLWRWCRRILGRLFRFLGRGILALPLLGRWTVILGGVVLLELLFVFGSYGSAAGLFWFLNLLLGVPLILYGVWCLRKLRQAAKELASGNLSYTVDSQWMLGAVKEQAEDLNHIRDGINSAVEERMKSERFRTELITNVSHDIKTPLTSIVNYVDLLAKEEPESETVREYVEVLSRQSARLKKLIDDLIEASKASTGALPVNPERCELGVLLDQSAGEYGERLEKAGLELIMSKPETPVYVMADGRHLWRIFDNLLSNVCKYALPGTRVYLDLRAEDSKAEVTLRNISRQQLNVSGEELMARFVRGDSSRSTEGSGLGLSIAMSLARLQNADMDVTVDGDLFKVTLHFNTVE